MINAKDAKKISTENKVKISDSDHLTNHLEQLVRKATNQGQFSTPKTTFPADRFSELVISQVMENLKDSGYKVSIDKNNAMQTITFNISW